MRMSDSVYHAGFFASLYSFVHTTIFAESPVPYSASLWKARRKKKSNKDAVAWNTNNTLIKTQSLTINKQEDKTSDDGFRNNG